MTAFLAIVKLTCRSAMRSHIFRLLLLLLVLSVVLVPNTLKGEGTAMGFIQLILEYSLGFVAFILSVSAVWISCSEICTDVESGQFHLIAVKPIPRSIVLLGKFSGVLLIHSVLLVVSAVLVYLFAMYQYGRQEFSKEERARVENEVFCGRRLYKPVKPDFEQLAKEELARRMADVRNRGQMLSAEVEGDTRRKALDAVKKELIGKQGEVAPGEVKFWEYQGLPETLNSPLFVRYKVFTGSGATMNQDTTFGSWIFRLVHQKRNAGDEKTVSDVVEETYAMPPSEILTIIPNEFELPQDQRLFYNGTVKIGYVSYDKRGQNVNFQEADGPFLMLRETGFLSNYARAVFVTFMGIAALAMIASALSAFLSLPISIFCSVTYIVAGGVSTYMLYALRLFEEGQMTWAERVGGTASRIMTYLLISLQDFFVTSKLAMGELITWDQIGQLVLYNIVIRGLPLFLFGMWLYTRRELALAVKR